MLIGIDGNEANVKNRVGSNIYSFQLLKALSKLKPNAVIYLKKKPLPDLPKQDSNWQYKVVGPKLFWTQIGLPLVLSFSSPKPDVFFTPGHYLPRWCPYPAVMAILDLGYIQFPEMFKKRDLWQLKNWTAYSVKKAKKILTISESSRSAIIDYYHLPPEKVVVTYPGLKMSKVNPKDNLKKYGVEGSFILYVGTLQPRKNLNGLIKAFAKLKNKNLKLVIVGKKGWLYENIFKQVKDLGLAEKVIFTGYVPDEDLPAFYKNAQCFILPSLYEGFGLPVLEAMHYGCPVVASNVSSLPEVVGKAGILVNPNDVNDITRGIKEAFKRKDELVKKGLRQCRQFSWEKCAKQTLAVLEDVAKNH